MRDKTESVSRACLSSLPATARGVVAEPLRPACLQRGGGSATAPHRKVKAEGMMVLMRIQKVEFQVHNLTCAEALGWHGNIVKSAISPGGRAMLPHHRMTGVGKEKSKLSAELSDVVASFVAAVWPVLAGAVTGGAKAGTRVTSNDEVVIALHGPDRGDSVMPPFGDHVWGVLAVRAVHIDKQDTASGDPDPDSNEISSGSKYRAVRAHDRAAAKTPALPDPNKAAPLAAISSRAELEPAPTAAPRLSEARLLKESDIDD